MPLARCLLHHCEREPRYERTRKCVAGTSSATVLAAIEENIDIVDLAMDSMSGLTSQPALGSVVSIMKQNHEDPGLDETNIRDASLYWEQVRNNYKAFETDFKGGSSDVYLHQMPGGQFTNLKEQARSLGITTDKWGLVANMYAKVNKMFGDIIKVTPSSKVVGDMALYMITNDLSPEDVLDPNKEISFPSSVVEFFKGEIGIPMGGFPEKLQKKYWVMRNHLIKEQALFCQVLTWIRKKRI